jgi:hypothetical protein
VQKNVTYMNLGKTTAFDADRKNTIRKGPGKVGDRDTIQKNDFQDKGFLRNAAIDVNPLYTNNFESQPRGADTNQYINQTTHNVSYKNPGEPKNIIKNPKVTVPEQVRPGLNKDTEYVAKYEQPGYNRLKFQTTNPDGLHYANKFAQKPRVHNIDTAYAKDYQKHQQRVMAALNKIN